MECHWKAESLNMESALLWYPKAYSQRYLAELHSTHQGIVKTKNFARSYVWWPTLNVDIETLIGNCTKCLSCRQTPPKISNPWPKCSEVFERIHLDFCGPLKQHYFLLLTDAYSKWIEVFIMKSITSAMTIRKLKECFARL